MSAVPGVILVIEDDPVLKMVNSAAVSIALAELAEDGLTGQWQVEGAESYEEALAILDQRSVDFISVDLALKPHESKLTRASAPFDGEPSGLRLLRELQNRPQRPLAIVYSGETNQAYAIDALTKYGVLAFYQKGAIDNEQYQNAVKTALWYKKAAELLANDTQVENLRQADQAWHSALAAAEKAGIPRHFMPANLSAAIQQKLHDAATGLPSAKRTQLELLDRIIAVDHWEAAEPHRWALIQITLDGFQPFIARHASQENAIFQELVSILRDVTALPVGSQQEIFCGRWLPAPITHDPRFLIVLPDEQIEHADAIADQIKTRFNDNAPRFGALFETDSPPTPHATAHLWTYKTTDVGDLNDLIDQIGRA